MRSMGIKVISGSWAARFRWAVILWWVLHRNGICEEMLREVINLSMTTMMIRVMSVMSKRSKREATSLTGLIDISRVDMSGLSAGVRNKISGGPALSGEADAELQFCFFDQPFECRKLLKNRGEGTWRQDPQAARSRTSPSQWSFCSNCSRISGSLSKEEGLTDEQMAQLDQIFSFIDRNQNGKLTRKELLIALRKSGAVRALLNIPGHELVEVQADYEGQGRLGSAEAWWCSLTEEDALYRADFIKHFAEHPQQALKGILLLERPKFSATHEWQPVPKGAACPPGLEYKMDLATGETLARLCEQNIAKLSVLCRLFELKVMMSGYLMIFLKICWIMFLYIFIYFYMFFMPSCSWFFGCRPNKLHGPTIWPLFPPKNDQRRWRRWRSPSRTSDMAPMMLGIARRNLRDAVDVFSTLNHLDREAGGHRRTCGQCQVFFAWHSSVLPLRISSRTSASSASL